MSKARVRVAIMRNEAKIYKLCESRIVGLSRHGYRGGPAPLIKDRHIDWSISMTTQGNELESSKDSRLYGTFDALRVTLNDKIRV